MDISVFFTSDLTSSERRISPQWSIKYLKQRLEQITGIDPKFQKLQYYPTKTSNEFTIVGGSEQLDEKLVADYNIQPLSRVHVTDTDPESKLSGLSAENNDESSQFKLTEEEYASRTNTVLQWKKDQQLGRFDPNFSNQKDLAQQQNEKLAESINVGSRCRVINIEGERRGTVRFVGKIDQLDKRENVWVGIEFDEPVGRNDGLIGQFRVFECRPKHGSFVKPKQVEVGDFPELDPFGSDEEEL